MQPIAIASITVVVTITTRRDPSATLSHQNSKPDRNLDDLVHWCGCRRTAKHALTRSQLNSLVHSNMPVMNTGGDCWPAPFNENPLPRLKQNAMNHAQQVLTKASRMSAASVRTTKTNVARVEFGILCSSVRMMAVKVDNEAVALTDDRRRYSVSGAYKDNR